MRDDGITVHRIGDPGHRAAVGLDGLDQGGQDVADPVGPHTGDQAQAPGLAVRVEAVHEGEDVLRARARADLDPHRVGAEIGRASCRERV